MLTNPSSKFSKMEGKRQDLDLIRPAVISDKPELTILINMSHDQVAFTLPTGRSWTRVVDTQAYWDGTWQEENPDLDPRTSANIDLESPDPVGDSYGVPAKSIVILRDET